MGVLCVFCGVGLANIGLCVILKGECQSLRVSKFVERRVRITDVFC